MSESEFILKVKELGYELNSVQIDQFRLYCNFLIEYNEHCNLTAIKTESDIYLKHFYDSLLILKYRDFSDKKVLDIGSGAGFPGVPLKIVCPTINLSCLDSNGKKTTFLMLLRDKLGIKYNVINKRAEDFAQESRAVYDFIVSRAVSSMPILSELAIPMIKINGELIAYRGAAVEDNGKYAANVLGGQIKDIYTDNLPFENSKRMFICVQKKCKTDMAYPRRYEKILKKPLQNLEK